METDSIIEALKVLHRYDVSNRVIARRRQVSRTTLDKISHGHIVKQQHRAVFKELMKELKQMKIDAFEAKNFDKSLAIYHEMYQLYEMDLGI